jgi:hypothetical protein
MEEIKINSIRATRKDNTFEIVQIVKNPMYGKEQEHRDMGYKDSFSGDNLIMGYNIIKKSLFKHEEDVVRLAILDYDNTRTDTELKVVGSRLLDLNENEIKDFFQVYKLADKELIRKNLKK